MFHIWIHLYVLYDTDYFKRNQESWFSCEIILMFKCHRGYLGHSLGASGHLFGHPCPFLPFPRPLPSSVSWSVQAVQVPGAAAGPLASRPYGLPCLPDSGPGQRGPLQAEHARGDHAQRGARCGVVCGWAGVGAPWLGRGRGAQKLTDPPGLVCLPSSPTLCLSLGVPLLFWLLGLSPVLFTSVSLPVSFACFFLVCHDLLPLPSPLPPPHVSLWAPPSPVASFLPDREDYGVRGHPWPVL